MSQPVSPFLTFAETFQRFRSNDSDVRNIYGLGELLRAAEHHARLLAQIEQWANEPMPAWTSAGDDQGKILAKAYIKALLESVC